MKIDAYVFWGCFVLRDVTQTSPFVFWVADESQCTRVFALGHTADICREMWPGAEVIVTCIETEAGLRALEVAVMQRP